MIRYSEELALEPIDYELLWIGSDASHPSIGSFGDFHFSAEPVWRVVSGYLGAVVADSAIRLSSHGHPIGSLGFGDRSGAVDLTGETFSNGRVTHAPDAGIALLADEPLAGSWGFTVVHGPSREKVSHRLALLGSLTRTGGRSG